MTELQLYGPDGLFHQVLKASATIEGRYAVLPGGSRDLDAQNVLTGIEMPAVKYPLVGCLPPQSVTDPSVLNVSAGWEHFSFRLLFLNTTAADGMGQLQERDPLTNTGLHRAYDDWQAMKTVAMNFLRALEILQVQLRGKFRLDDRNQWRIMRVSDSQKDRVSGVIVQFGCALASACDYTDIPNPAAIQLPQGF